MINASFVKTFSKGVIPMNMTQELMEEIAWLDENKTTLCGNYTAIHIGEWEDDGKYQHQQIVFKYQDKFYAFWIVRSGSYFTDYYYQYPDQADEVHLVEKTIRVWE